jgi:hypothetical protein
MLQPLIHGGPYRNFCSVLAGLLCSFNHENVLSIKDLIIPLNGEGQCEDIYIITELLDTDLSKVIYSPQPLIDDHCQYFVYQVSPSPSISKYTAQMKFDVCFSDLARPQISALSASPSSRFETRESPRQQVPAPNFPGVSCSSSLSYSAEYWPSFTKALSFEPSYPATPPCQSTLPRHHPIPSCRAPHRGLGARTSGPLRNPARSAATATSKSATSASRGSRRRRASPP